MHIPDGFLSTPVWAALDAVAAPAAGYAVRRAQAGFDDSRAPLLGVMGAFVFAAQMINFPVGVGTSGHLVGGALLAYVLGPAAAMVVMTAILAIQALVFQDGGILALGANVVNMALAGVLAGYLPYRLFAATRFAMFAGAFLSVLVGALLALAELWMSGVALPAAAAGISIALFVVSAALEGAITLAVVEALEAINPGFLQRPLTNRRAGSLALGAAAVSLAVAGVMIASSNPDGLERLAQRLGIASHARTLLHTPLAEYELANLDSPWLRKAAAGLSGLGLVYAACLLFGRAARARSR